MSGSIHVERGGRGRPTVLLLHGLGASAAAWTPFAERLEADGASWIAVDLPGHGASDPMPRPTFAGMAARVAEVLPGDELVVVGHSLGGVVGLALRTGWFGPTPSHTVLVGPKLVWAAAELEAGRERAARPVRYFESEEEARVRALRLAGMPADARPEWTDRLTRREAGKGYRLSMDPAASPSAHLGRDPLELIRAMALAGSTPLTMTAGERDPGVTLDQLRELDPDARLIPGAGHSPHVECPDELLRLVRDALRA